MTTGSVAEQVTSVPGELHYLAPESTVLRRFTAPGASINTGSYESHVVPIRNGRPVQDSFRLDTHGFELLPHWSAVTDFTNKGEVDARTCAARPRRPRTRRSPRPHSSTSTTAPRVPR